MTRRLVQRGPNSRVDALVESGPLGQLRQDVAYPMHRAPSTIGFPLTEECANALPMVVCAGVLLRCGIPSVDGRRRHWR
jgi:hypothetical protein